MEKLLKIQAELKAPKNQFNSFGKYSYRSCEDILEAVKPLLVKYDLCMIIYDTVENIGNHNYVKSNVLVWDKDNANFKIEVSGYARESETKKGMDDSQITGSTSSYARKYALNGMFLIDDTKDADTQDNRTPTKTEQVAETFNARPVFDRGKAVNSITKLMDSKNYPEEERAVVNDLIKNAVTREDFESIYNNVKG